MTDKHYRDVVVDSEMGALKLLHEYFVSFSV